jgi:hypothetical protein
MTTTTTNDSLANVPHPAGAVKVCDWDDLQAGTEHATRYFRGSSRLIERDGDIDKDITVEIYGTQSVAGDVVRRIMAIVDDRDAVDLRSSDARQLGRALIALADEAEQMNGYDKIEVTR